MLCRENARKSELLEEKTVCDLEKRLTEAIRFAIRNGWELYNRPNILMKRVREAKHVSAFGAGNFFQQNFSWFPDLNAACEFVCDSDPKKQNTIIGGKRCISLDELRRLEDVVVIVTVGNYKNLVKELQKLGIECYPLEYFILRTCDDQYLDGQWFQNNKDDILSAWQLFNGDVISQEIFVEDFCIRVAPHLTEKTYSELKSAGQSEYFGTDVIHLGKSECFLDAGAYDGDTIREFIKVTGNSFQKIYAFEVAADNFHRLKASCADYPADKVMLFQAGVSDQEREILIDGNAMGWREASNKGVPSRLVTIDKALAGEKVTFIKMDIEGSEMKALKGSEKILRDQTPQLAICTYHLLSDLWRIPLFIKQIDPRYRVYLRHHSQTVWDTVCYATTEGALSL